jgi:hypothetical protein
MEEKKFKINRIPTGSAFVSRALLLSTMALKSARAVAPRASISSLVSSRLMAIIAFGALFRLEHVTTGHHFERME